MLRTTVLWGAIANPLVCVLCLDAGELTDTTLSKYAKVQAIGLSEVQWTTGFWANRFATCRDRSVPAMWELMKGGQYKPFYEHFLIAAGEMDGEHHGAAVE